MKTYEITCANCGEKFIYKTDFRPKKFCSDECQRENQKRINAWKRKLKKKQEQEKKEEAEKNRSLSEVSEIAKAHGMTYGQYMAQKYIKDHEKEKRKNGKCKPAHQCSKIGDGDAGKTGSAKVTRGIPQKAVRASEKRGTGKKEL